MGTHGGDGIDRSRMPAREPCSQIIASRWLLAATLATAFAALGGSEASAQLYWNNTQTSGSLTGSTWGTSATGPFTTAWTSGTTISFTANSSITGATTAVRGISVINSSTVTWTGGGTLNTGSTMAVVDVGAGSVLNMTSQTISSGSADNTATGFIKNGAGTWNLTNTAGSGAMRLGFTINAGRVVTTSGNNLGNGPLTLNGGTWEATGNNTYNASSVTIGGTFAMEGSGNNAVAASSVGISLGNATRTITNNAGGYRQLLGVISGSSGVGLTLSGTGVSVLGNSANTFDGPFTVTGGEVFFNGGGALGSGTSIVLDGGRITSGTVSTSGAGTAGPLTSASIASSKTISVSGSAGNAIGVQSSTGVLSFDGVIADKNGSTGSWAKAGSGRLTLGGVSTYTGSTSITNGTLQLASGSNRLPTTTVVSLGQAASTNLGTLDLNGNNQQIAGLASVTGSNSGGSTNTVTSAGAAGLTINVASGTFTYSAGSAANSGVISGAISVVKNGAGTQILGGANGYTGTTTVNAGLLQINGSQTGNGAATVSGGELKVNGSLGTSTVALNGGILSGTGSVGAVTVNSGATISPGNSPGTLTVGNLALNGGGNYNWQVYDSNGAAGTGWDLISGTGTLTINATSGSPFNLNLWTLSTTGPDTNGNALNFNAAVNKTWTIGTFTGGISGASAGWYTINTSATNGTGGFANSFTGGSFSLVTSGNNLNLVYTAPVLTNYDYIAGTGNWSTGSNWAGGNAPSGAGLSVTFSGAGGTATNDSQLSSVTGITFTGSASGSYVVAGSALSLGGAGVVNNSSFAQTVQNALTGTTSTVVNAAAGNLTLSGTLDNGGFGVTLQGASAISMTAISGTGTLTKIDGGTATLNGAVATNSVSVSGGTLRLGVANALGNAAALTVSGSGTFDVGNAIDTIGSLTTSGNATVSSGTLVAAAYNLGGGTIASSATLGGGTLTNTGATSLNGTAGAGTVNLNAGSLTLGSAGRLTGTPIVSGSSSGTLVLGGNETIASLAGSPTVNLGSATLTVGDATSTTYSGTMTGGGGVTKNGSGTLTFSGSAAYTGPTVVNAGAIGISNAAARTFASSVSGSGGLVKSGAGTLTLTGTNTYSGGTTITEGIVSVAAASNLTTSGSIGVSGAAALRFAGSDTFGAVGQQLVLSATQSSSPIVNLTSGQTSTFLSDVVLASGTNRFEPTGSSATLTLAGNLSGAGTLLKAAQGFLVLSGTSNTFSGGLQIGNGKVTVSAGSGLGSGPVVLNPTSNGASGNVTLELNESVSIGSLSTSTSGGGTGGRFITIASGKTLAVNQSSSATFSGDISGAGGFTKSGAASLTLTGSNTYAGPTTVSDGSITFSGAKTFATGGTVTVTNGGGIVLDSNGTYGAVGQSLVLSASQSASPVLSMTSGATPTFQGDVSLASGVNRIEANGSSGVLTLTGNLSGAGTLLKAASGELVLAGTANSATGATQVSNGKITVNAGSALGTGDLTFAQTGVNGTRVDLKNAAQTIGNLATVWSATAQPTATTVTQRLDLNNGVVLTINQTGTTTFGDYAGAPANVTGLGTITGSGSIVKAGAGSLTLSGSNAYTGGTTLSAGTLVAGNANAFGTGAITVSGGTLDLGSLAVGNAVTVSGGNLANASAYAGATTITGTVTLASAPNSAVTIAAGGVLQGTATVASLAGAGLVSAGNSPGILTAGSFDGSGGLDAAFEITGTAPAYALPSASINDVLRLTGGSPFTTPLGVGNTIDVYFSGAAADGGTYQGGFFTTLSAADLLTAVQSANWVFWGQDATGARSFNGLSYKPLLDFASISGVTVTTVGLTADFGDGPVAGSATQFLVAAVPEPSTVTLAGIGLVVAAWAARRRTTSRRPRRTGVDLA